MPPPADAAALRAGKVFWLFLALGFVFAAVAAVQGILAYGDTALIEHPLSFIVSFGALLFLPPLAVEGWWRVLVKDHAADAAEDAAGAAWFALAARIAAFGGAIAGLAFFGLPWLLDLLAIEVASSGARAALGAVLLVPMLAVWRRSALGIDFIIGSLFIWGGLFVHVHLGEDPLSRWLLYDFLL